MRKFVFWLGLILVPPALFAAFVGRNPHAVATVSTIWWWLLLFVVHDLWSNLKEANSEVHRMSAQVGDLQDQVKALEEMLDEAHE